MKVRKDYYLKFAKEVREFCKVVDDKDYLILKSLAQSKEFKAYKRKKSIYDEIPSLFSEEELRVNYAS